MSIKELLKVDLNNLLEYIKTSEQIENTNEFVKFSYALQNDKNGNFQYEVLTIGNRYVIDPAHYKSANNLTSHLMKKIKQMNIPGYFSVDSDECNYLLPYQNESLGYCDFKLSVNIQDESLHDKDKPITYKSIVGWEGHPLQDISADYTFLIKDFKIMQDFA